MKKLFTALIFCLGIMGLTSCTEGVAYAQPVVVNQTVLYCDSYGCRYVVAPYYYNTPRVWVGYRGYYGGTYGGYRGYAGYPRGGYYNGGSHYYYHGGGYRGGFHGGRR